MNISPVREAGLPECKEVRDVINMVAPATPKKRPNILFHPNLSCKKIAANTDTIMGVAMISKEA